HPLDSAFSASIDRPMTTDRSAAPNSTAQSALEERFTVNRVESSCVDSDCATITFDAWIDRHNRGQRIFCGLLSRDLSTGVGLSIDTATGEIVDLINDQGIIGYLNSCPFPGKNPVPLHLRMEKFGSTFICKVEVAGEAILYPAVLLTNVTEIGAVLGSTQGQGGAAVFSRTSLSVSPNITAAA
ncbi:MAG: hypothetical protein ACC661_04215, partial [Verrucomicrobiales bacterium]